MTIIKCPKCNSDLQINIAKALDEYGEVFFFFLFNYIIIYVFDCIFN